MAPSIVHLDDLGFDAKGFLSRDALMEKIGGPIATWREEGRKGIDLFAGSTMGNDRIHERDAHELSRLIENEGWYSVNGGIARGDGLMAASLENCSRIYSFVPDIFAMNARGAPSTNNIVLQAQTALQSGHVAKFGKGLNPAAYNIITHDFYDRKPGMMLLADAAWILPGGVGTLEEMFEAIIHNVKNGKITYVLNRDGFYNDIRAQIDLYTEAGLLPTPEDGRPLVRFLNTPEEIKEATKKDFQTYAPKDAPNKHARKPAQTLQNLMMGQAEAFLKPIVSFLSSTSGTWWERPRIGVVASSHIGLRQSPFNLRDPKLRAEITRTGQRLGDKLGAMGATLVIAGSNKGHRASIAGAALAHKNAQVIWIQKFNDMSEPLRIERKNGQELIVGVARHIDVNFATELCAQGFIGSAGGIHATQRILSIVTRIQTGAFEYADLGNPDDFKRDLSRRLCFKVYSPKIGDGSNLFTNVQRQLVKCSKEGFYTPEDLSTLIRVSDSTTEIAEQALAESHKRAGDRDPLLMMSQRPNKRCHRPSSRAEATAL